MQDQARPTPIGPILAIVGGALLAVGSFLEWASVSGGGDSQSVTGMDGSDGFITLAAGAIALVCGLVSMRGFRRPLAILAILAGLIGGGVGVYDAVTAEDSVLETASEEIAAQSGVSAAEVRTLLDQLIDAGDLSIDIKIGLYVVIAGGVLALIGGALMLTSARRAVPAAPVGPIPQAAPSTMPPPSAPARQPDLPPTAPAPPAPPPPDQPTA